MEAGMDEKEAMMAIQISIENDELNDNTSKQVDCGGMTDEEEQQLQRAIQMSKQHDMDYTQDETKYDNDETASLLSDIR